MFEKEITFDRAARGIIVVAIISALVWLLNRLSAVLLPFFVAWAIAYMLYPLVKFLEQRCRLRNRVLSIVVALVLVIAALVGLLWLIIPPTINELERLSGLISTSVTQYLGETDIAANIDRYIRNIISENDIVALVKQDQVVTALQYVASEAWQMVYRTMGFVVGLFGLFIIVLYMFFILMDYEKITEQWIRLLPQKQRPFASQLAGDVASGMNAYFRGQSLIALCVGILFSIGFLIIDFPLAIGLGLFIGLLNLVPYLQLIGFIPTLLLAVVKAANTGQNFWVILLCALAVFAVVQLIQDLYLTPKIMGHVMGLNPAVILLSLSVWGSLLGFIGLIIALPLTTLCFSYYKRFVLKE
ncbi:MAG: AI-2E family transporter [Bacteroidaceae bacterium]|nr:AI-2E family transporter [Bacteroidaceae bacterium]